MPVLSQEFLRTLKDKLNIVDIAQGYFNLEKRGSVNYWACCPFHHEKTPSFTVNEQEQFYHCFGCGASGDVFKLVAEMETVSFMDAVKLLAERANVPIPQDEQDSKRTAEQKRKRDTILKILNDCAHFYLDNLNSGKADAHIEYILSRKIPSNIVRTFGLGASLNFTDLPKYLLSKGYSKQDILDSGTVNEVDGRLTDAQGGRLIYPIINAYDDVIAFGGRVLKKTNSAKYVNTRATIIFDKKKNLYNINLLKKLKRTQAIKEVIMVEGYMDTISLYQAGFKNVVASMGTSLTQDQARLIKRYTENVLISYDGDSAGQNANMRGLDILKNEGLNVRVVPLPDGLDPDDVIKQRGAEGYQACLDAAMPLIDYKIEVLKRGFDLSKTEDKRMFVSKALAVVRTADSASEQDELLKALRNATGITFEALRRDLTNAPTVKETAKNVNAKRADMADAVCKASRYVLASFLFNADFTRDCALEDIVFFNDVHILIAKYILAKKRIEEQVRISELFEFFDSDTPESDELSRILDYSAEQSFDGEIAEKYFNDCLIKLKLADLDGIISDINAKLNASDNLSERAQYAQQITQLIKQKEKIKKGLI